MDSELDLENIKSKIIEQIISQYPKEQAEEFIYRINEMNEEQFVIFLKQQGIIKENTGEEQKCIFCSIVSEEIPSIKIEENNFAISILELNPISKGHSLIIPKEHLDSEEKLTEEIKKFAKEISSKIQKTFEPKEIKLIPTNILGHEIINILPVYENENINSPRKKSSTEELKKIKEKIEEENQNKETPKNLEEQKDKEIKEEINEKNTWLPKRFP